MSPDPTTSSPPDRGLRGRFALALAVFAAWAIGLAVLAFTTAEKPRALAPAPTSPR